MLFKLSFHIGLSHCTAHDIFRCRTRQCVPRANSCRRPLQIWQVVSDVLFLDIDLSRYKDDCLLANQVSSPYPSRVPQDWISLVYTPYSSYELIITGVYRTNCFSLASTRLAGFGCVDRYHRSLGIILSIIHTVRCCCNRIASPLPWIVRWATCCSSTLCRHHFPPFFRSLVKVNAEWWWDCWYRRLLVTTLAAVLLAASCDLLSAVVRHCSYLAARSSWSCASCCYCYSVLCS